MTFLSTPYSPHPCSLIFFLNDTATTEIYTLSLHDALPIWRRSRRAEIAPRIRREKFSGKTRRSRRAASIGRTPVGRRPEWGRRDAYENHGATERTVESPFLHSEFVHQRSKGACDNVIRVPCSGKED